MFIMVLIFNAIAMKITKKNAKIKNNKWTRFINVVGSFFYFIPNKLGILWERITYHSTISKTDVPEYVGTRITKNKFAHVYDYWKIFWEWFAIILALAFLFWILENIFVNGCIGVASQYARYKTIIALFSGNIVYKLLKDMTSQAITKKILSILLDIFSYSKILALLCLLWF